MSTTIVCLGDLHLHPGPRRDAKLRALDQALNVVEATRPGAVIFVGDLFHATSTPEDRNALAERVQRSASIAPTGIVPGNHDGPGELEIFARLAGAWPITVFVDAGCYRMRLATGHSATIFALPYQHKQALVSAGVAHHDMAAAAALMFDGIFADAAKGLAVGALKGDLTLMVAHQNIEGAIASNGQPQIGTSDISVLPRHLALLGSIPKIFGHIHRPQDLHGATFVGSMGRNDFGEIEDKRFVVVSFGQGEEMIDGEHGADWQHSIESIGLAVPALYYTEGDLTRDGYTYEVIAGPGGERQHAPTIECVDCYGIGSAGGRHDETEPCGFCDGRGRIVSWKGCEVRARCRVKASERTVVNKALVLAEYAEAALLQLDPITVPDRQLRAPEVAAAKTLPDKVVAWCELGGFVASEGVRDKLAALETISDPTVHIDAARDHATDIAAGDFDKQKATVAA